MPLMREVGKVSINGLHAACDSRFNCGAYLKNRNITSSEYICTSDG